MKKKIISQQEYDKLNYATLYDYNSDGYDLKGIIDIYEYLKDKQTKDIRGNDIYNAHLRFLDIALGRAFFMPRYIKVNEEFLKSNYLSQELKKEIYNIINNDCSEDLKKLLNSDKHMNDFTMRQIKMIEKSIRKTHKASTDSDIKQKCNDILEIYGDYFFVLDGKGPINYTKKTIGEKMPIAMLELSNIISNPSFYSGYGVDKSNISEDHLFSLYKKFVKFYPNKAEEFVKMIKMIPRLTGTEFVNNYLIFVNNGFDSAFCNKNGKVSIDGVHGAARDLVGAVSIVTMLDNSDEKTEKRLQDYIISEFDKMVEEYKNIKQIEKNNNKQYKVKKLGSKI